MNGTEPLVIALAGAGGATLALCAAELAHDGRRILPWLATALAALSRSGTEGAAPSEAERRRLGLLAGALTGALALLMLGPGPPAVAGLLGPWAAGALIARRRRGYRRALEAQIPALASGVADALASGGSLRTALSDLAGSSQRPAAIELARVRADLELGSPPREALGAMARRSESERVDRLVAAMLSQQGTGGELAGLLRSHADAARRRGRAEAAARSATAQARLTGGMVAAMPLGAAALVELASPGFVASMLSEPVPLALLALAAALQLGAYLLIQRLGRVRA